MSTIFGVLITFGLITFSAYMIIGIIRDWRDKKKRKIQEKGDKKE